MKKFLKIMKILFILIFLILGSVIAYVFVALPKSEPAPIITVEATPERLGRGKYLVTSVTGCLACHSVRDSKYYSEPVVPGTEGQGSVFIDPQLGTVVAQNITPAALKNWSDGEILRAMISGLSRDGHALFPIMPDQEFALMSREDLYSVIAYIRSLEPKTSDLPQTELDFPLNLIMRTIPKPAVIQEKAPANRGEYLARIASCHTCHTPQNKRGGKIPGMDFAGGMEFPAAGGGIVRSVNITPDRETGIGTWTRDQFTSTFKRFESPDLRQIPVEKGNTIMPWTTFSGMTTEDLGAIYDYIMSVKPVHQKIERVANLPQSR